MLIEIIKNKNFKDHKAIISFYDKTTSLKGFIAIHNTNLGPALGGTRFWEYSDEEEALNDILNLSTAMTYKCAISGVKGGGGKGVIIKNKNTRKTKKFLYKYAEIVNVLNGSFYTGEDVGITARDVKILRNKSKFIIGTISGSPSSYTALSVFYSIKAALKYYFNNEEIKKYSFAIKGIGKVGSRLLELIIKEGGILFVADINPQIIKRIKKKYRSVEIVDSDKIHKLKVDVYSPCALGGDINENNVKELNCKIICGAANNQLVNREIGWDIYKKGIVYVPDYLANAGGLINVSEELNPRGYSRKHVLRKIKNIKKIVYKVLKYSEKLKKPTNFIVDEWAEKIFKKEKDAIK